MQRAVRKHILIIIFEMQMQERGRRVGWGEKREGGKEEEEQAQGGSVGWAGRGRKSQHLSWKASTLLVLMHRAKLEPELCTNKSRKDPGGEGKAYPQHRMAGSGQCTADSLQVHSWTSED